MRLDEYLVSEGLVSSRSRARRYIERGLVKVNGVVVIKPSRKVEYGSQVEVTAGDRPEGYFKLQAIQEQSGLLKEGDAVLDLGSSAGGFLLYAATFAGRVVGVELSEEFHAPLARVAEEHPNVSVISADAFTMDVRGLGSFDVVLNDLTVEPAASIEVLARFLPLLEEGGRVLQVLKLGEREDYAPLLKLLERKGLKVEKVIRPEKKEAYVIASKK